MAKEKKIPFKKVIPLPELKVLKKFEKKIPLKPLSLIEKVHTDLLDKSEGSRSNQSKG